MQTAKASGCEDGRITCEVRRRNKSDSVNSVISVLCRARLHLATICILRPAMEKGLSARERHLFVSLVQPRTLKDTDGS